MQVFISYAREDYKIARKLFDDLRRAGLNPWLDTEALMAGQDWRVTISQAIRESLFFLALLSSNSVSKRGFVQKELKIALELLDELPENELFIIPVLLDQCEPKHEKLKNLHWVTLYDSYQRGLEKILRAIKPDRELVSPVDHSRELEHIPREFLIQFTHEFATPLYALESQVHYVEKMFTNEIRVKDPHEQFKYLKEEITLLKFLLNDLHYQFGNFTDARKQYNFQKAELKNLVLKIKNLLEPEAKFDRKIGIELDLDEIPMMFVDKLRFEQVIFNLLHNAVKYSIVEKHDILVSYKRLEKDFHQSSNKNWHSIEVSNWGIGIIEGEEESIFEKYSRGSNVREVAPTGTGIGLAVSKEIVLNHAGFLQLTNNNQPTIFTIFLPEYLTEKEP